MGVRTRSVLVTAVSSVPMPGALLVLRCWMHSGHFNSNTGLLGDRKVLITVL